MKAIKLNKSKEIEIGFIVVQLIKSLLNYPMSFSLGDLAADCIYDVEHFL